MSKSKVIYEEENRAVLSNLVPDNWAILHVPRASRGGGVGFMYKKQFSPKLELLNTTKKFTSFEHQLVVMTSISFTFRFIVIYRPPPSTNNKIKKSAFIDELGDLLELTSTMHGKLVLLGDFNVHVDSGSDSEATDLQSLFDCFGLVHHVHGATHIEGHTLDLVVSRASDDIVHSCEVGSFISDHNAIHIALKATKPHPSRKQITFRNLRSIDTKQLSHDIESSKLVNSHTEGMDVDEIVSLYNNVLQELLDKHAPVQTRTIAERLVQPWMNNNITKAKRDRHKAEILYRKDNSVEHRREYKMCCEVVNDWIQKSKETYFIQKIEECDNDQKKLFKIVDKLLGRGKSSSLPDHKSIEALVQIFNEFFITKIPNIRLELSKMGSSVQGLHCPPLDSLLKPSSSKLCSFKLTTAEEITAIIKKASKASCSLDPIPTSLLRDILSSIATTIADLVNSSLTSGKFPSELKSAIVKPLLKKPSADLDILKNYRPVSNLSFISKIIEKVVAARLLDHMMDYGLMDQYQSAYRKGHSTETALVRVHNDILRAVDKGLGVCLILLDLSAAFDTVDHTILLTFLKEHIGLDGQALDILKSYLTGRTQCVSVDGVLSELSELAYGVP